MSKKILVTGVAGFIGRAVVRSYRAQGYWVRGLDRVAADVPCDDFVEAELESREDIRKAVKGIDVVVHLAAEPDDADFVDRLLKPNVLGLYHVADAAVAAGVKRLVLASSIQVSFPWGASADTVRPEDPPDVRNHYSLTKVWAEQLGRFYASQFGISVIAVRIGWVPRGSRDLSKRSRIEEWDLRNYYLSLPDLGRFFCRCLESKGPGAGEFLLTFALGKQLRPPWIDLSSARTILGYVPEDRFPDNIELVDAN